MGLPQQVHEVSRRLAEAVSQGVCTVCSGKSALCKCCCQRPVRAINVEHHACPQIHHAHVLISAPCCTIAPARPRKAETSCVAAEYEYRASYEEREANHSDTADAKSRLNVARIPMTHGAQIIPSLRLPPPPKQLFSSPLLATFCYIQVFPRIPLLHSTIPLTHRHGP